ncbi:hypothetical protein [Enterococcus sp. AZ109]|uniref:hypothetical protein n=1 Tax=Enterococcus sp. AZ109 TaxID=2774634 RepID=UPI003F257682
MSDIELAESITNLLPVEYQGRMIFSLDRLKNAVLDQRVFKQFTVFLHLNLYPNKNEYWDLADKSYDYWHEWANSMLITLQRKNAVVS